MPFDVIIVFTIIVVVVIIIIIIIIILFISIIDIIFGIIMVVVVDISIVTSVLMQVRKMGQLVSRTKNTRRKRYCTYMNTNQNKFSDQHKQECRQ